MNKDAADLLIAEEFYAPSVHCSYYKFLQQAIYILRKYGYNENAKEENSHEKIREQLFGLLVLTCGYRASLNFNKDFWKVRKIRRRSDYQDTIITQSLANEAKDRSNNLLIMINSLYESAK